MTIIMSANGQKQTATTNRKKMLHELWVDPEGLDTYCYAGPEGNAARALLPTNSKLETTIEAGSHFEAMTKYYEYHGYGRYETCFPEIDKLPYPTGSSPTK